MKGENGASNPTQPRRAACESAGAATHEPRKRITLFSDDDGEARGDWAVAGDARDPQTLRLEERLLPVGQVASVAGTWSPERSAIVAGGEGAIGPGVSVILGPPEKLAGQGGGLPLPASFASYLITATVFTALGAGLVWFSIAVLPGLR